jgi:hypothetical protein
VAYAAWLLGDGSPLVWLRPAAVAVGVVGLAATGVAALRVIAARSRRGWPPAWWRRASPRPSPRCPLWPVTSGPFGTPFERDYVTALVDETFIRNPTSVARNVPSLEQARRGAPYLLATQTAVFASIFIDATGEEALPIGGYTGTTPSPTLAQIEADVCHGQFHLALIADGPDPRLHWIAQHWQDLSVDPGFLQTYYCAPPAGC